MRITLKLYATLTDYLPAQSRQQNLVELTVDEASTIASVVEPYGLPPKLVHLVLVNGVYVPPGERATRRLQEGDVLAIWPPIAGG
jgi:sulfur carrier protein ThiS